jgi:D-glycero-alpha-D-manno-heptose-7-phosphate kinase
VEPQQITNGAVPKLFKNIMMFWTGHQRPAATVLTEQKAKTPANLEILLHMRDQAHGLCRLFSSHDVDVTRLGQVLDEGWRLKRRLGSKITTSDIDRYYDRAIEAGAMGGKLCGAGGGGFLMFLVRPDRQESVRQALGELKTVSLGYDVHGSRVLYPAD